MAAGGGHWHKASAGSLPVGTHYFQAEGESIKTALHRAQIGVSPSDYPKTMEKARAAGAAQTKVNTDKQANETARRRNYATDAQVRTYRFEVKEANRKIADLKRQIASYQYGNRRTWEGVTARLGELRSELARAKTKRTEARRFLNRMGINPGRRSIELPNF